jgi:hypothetical protein
MKKACATTAAVSIFMLAPFLAVGTARAGAAFDVAADVHLGFRAGDADVDVFYDTLAPYGDWVDTGRYGLCWAPRGVEHHWRPYHYGHWVYTDYEWTWVGDEEWAWGPYHYGRWAFDPAYGWIWVPGSVWAPAWVAWRWGGGYAGWAPLPPEADLSAGPAEYGIDPLAFIFVEERFLVEPALASHYVPPARNVTIVNVTRNVTNYRVVDNRVVNHGVPVDAVERAAGHAVPRVRVTEHTAPAPTRVRGNEVAMFRPAVPRAPATPSRPRAATSRSLAAPPSATPDPAELKRRQDQERERLQAAEAKERDELRRLHEREKATPPANVSPPQLQERHQAEERAQAQHEERQKQMLEERQARERKAAEQGAKQRQEQQKGKQEKDKKKEEKKEKPD